MEALTQNSVTTESLKLAKQRVEIAIEALKNGKGILLMDAIDRENEADLIFAAEHIQKEDVALMIRYCSGIICLCLTPEHADYLRLPPMVSNNTSRFQTAFTVSIEALENITTGISAADRLQTIRVATSINANPSDLSRPGHVFPLRASKGGVLEREGHTEGSVDLMRLANLRPEAVLCELMNDDGTVARFPEVEEFSKIHNFPIVSIEDLVLYRSHIRNYE